MFDVGFLELMLIGIVALVVIGPERLPDVARTVGTWINKAQRFVRGVKSDLASELKSGELRDLLGDQRKQISELRQMVQSTKRELQQTTSDAVNSAKSAFDDLEESAADAGIVKPRHSARKNLPAVQTGSESSGTDSTLDSQQGSKPSLRKATDKVTENEQGTPAPASVGKDNSRVTEAAGRPVRPAADEPASDAVSRPVNTGPRTGSWASGIAVPDASNRNTDN